MNNQPEKMNNIQKDMNNIQQNDSNQTKNNEENIHSRSTRDEKATKRMKKASKKKKKEEKIFNRTLKSNHWTNKALRSVIIITCLSLVAGVGYVIKHEVERYNNTSQWKKLQRVQMSDMEPFMLSLNDKDYVTANEIIELKTKIWNQQTQSFNQNVSQKEIDTFNQLYDSFEIKNDSLNQFKSKVINQYWPLKVTQSTLIKNNTIQTDSFIDVAKYLNQSSKELSVDVQDASADSFVKQTEELNQKLFDDLNKIQNFHQNLLSLIEKPDEPQKRLKSDVNPNDIEVVFEALNDLNYDWPELNQLSEVKSKALDYSEVNEKKRVSMETYQNDVQLEKAFKEYLNKYKKDIDTLNKNKVEVKDFVGMTRKDVENWASKNGIIAQFDEQLSSSKKENEIIHQSILPKEYKYILKGSSIVFVVNIDNSSTMESVEETIISSEKKETSSSSSSDNKTEFNKVEEETIGTSSSYEFSSSSSNRR